MTRAFVQPLVDEFGADALALDDPATLEVAVDRASSLARSCGLEDTDDRRAVLRCMVLLGSDLSRSSGADADIRLTLEMTDRAPEQRVRRITRIAQTAADELGGPGGLGSLRATATPPSPPVSQPTPSAEPDDRSPDTASPTAGPAGDSSVELAGDEAGDQPADRQPPSAERVVADEAPVADPVSESAHGASRSEPAPETDDDFGFSDGIPASLRAPASSSDPESDAPREGHPDPFAALADDPALAPPRSRGPDASGAPAQDTGSSADSPRSARATGAPGADERAPVASIPGYDEVREEAPGLLGARDATTGERVLALAARGDADAALARLAGASSVVHRTLEKITDTVAGSIAGRDVAFAVVADEAHATMDARRSRLVGLTRADADAVVQAHLLSAGALAPHLAQIVSEKQRVHERLVLTWASEIAEAVQEAHHAGLAHAMIDDTMVTLDRHGVLILRGLGLADPTDPTLDAYTDETLKGVAPERVAAAAEGEPIRPEHSARADIWSLGVLVYTLIAGRPPFEGHRSSLLRDIVTRDIEPVTRVAEGASDAAADACTAALTRDPAGRPPTMAAFAEILRDAASAEGGGKRRLGLFGRKG